VNMQQLLERLQGPLAGADGGGGVFVGTSGW